MLSRLPALPPVLFAAGLLAAAPARAQDAGPAFARALDALSAEPVGEDLKHYDAARLVARPVQGGRAEPSLVTVEGRVARRQYLTGPDRSGLEAFRRLQSALTQDGWRVRFQCERATCGSGQYALKNAATFKDIGQSGSVRYLLAEHDGGGRLGLLVLGELENATRTTNGRTEIDAVLVEPPG